ncbi:hypothetical protein BV22DRAFT_1055824 [Leucogyrophana mollusca]|uniref:Uncharacterized protein n=1 Tax=Leucogyrophana mollusca TaxID=85980 RepID=A0ACB8BZ37_9AGAM|nr:hypothetical protein BV22DRAFT_1055824 [Leucogyrophana mollusca]
MSENKLSAEPTLQEQPANTTPAVATQPSASEKPKRVGLELAEATFGPLLSPIPGTTADWQNYTLNRYKTIKEAKARNIFPRLKGYESPGSDDDDYDMRDGDEGIVVKNIRRRVRDIEKELGLEDKTLQKCVRVLKCDALLEEIDDPRTVDTLVRFYSPSAPVYIDVHLFYHSRSRLYNIEWSYSLGYRIHRRPSPTPADAAAIAKELNPGIQTMHTRNGWRSISWGLFDDSNGNYGPNWRRIEDGEVDLYEDAVLDIYEAIFGKPIESADPGNAEAEIERRRKLVRAVQLLLASVGVGYEIACDDEETDEGYPYGFGGGGPKKIRWTLEGLSDRWFARGVRKACGFQLKKDPEGEIKGKQERMEMAEAPEYEGGEFDDSDNEEPGCPSQ